MSITVSRRTGANINGALIAMGILGIFDNVVIHWVLGLHRAIEDSPYALEAEIFLIAVSEVLLIIGLWRERAARQGAHESKSSQIARSSST